VVSQSPNAPALTGLVHAVLLGSESFDGVQPREAYTDAAENETKKGIEC